MEMNFTRVNDDPPQEQDTAFMKPEPAHGFTILAVNTGSTSTKMAVYRDRTPIVELTVAHSAEEIARFAVVTDQLGWRKRIILSTLDEHGIELDTLSAVISRGGLLRPIESGVYGVNSLMIDELMHCMPQHASNLSAMIAAEIARECGVEAYIADPVVVDERMEIAKLCGIREIRRRSIFHALNQKATARIHAESLGRRYEDMNFVIAHMGGGISVAAHLKGRAVDCNNALDGEGPIAPERAGTIPAGALIDLCYSGRYTHEQARALIVGGGGLVSLAGTNSVKELELRENEGDEEARTALDLLCYTVAKEIGAMAAALSGEVDAIILTGGIAYSRRVTDAIASRCRFVAPVTVYAGENELQSLALNALRVLRGETQPKIYV